MSATDDSGPTRSSKKRKKNNKDDGNIKQRLRTNPSKKRPPPDTDSDTADDNDQVVMLDIADIISMSLNGMKKEDTPNEKYLKTLTKSKRRKLEKEEKRIMKMNTSTIPLRYKILESNLPEKTKVVVMQKVEQFETSDAGASGFHKLKNYMDRLLCIPFGVYHRLPVTKTDPHPIVSNFLGGIKTSLDDCIYGQDVAKMRLMEVVAKWITNPKSKGNIIGLCGPPGVGKTTLIKHGLSKAIDIPFAFMPLGGCNNPSILEGHDYTYEGSKNGKLVDILIEQRCMNPIIFFDELDKLGESFAGKDISGMLTHLTDFTQNDSVHDRYFADIEFDFSKCLFIFSFNDENKINPILRDRITVIKMKGFSRKEKLEIAKKFTTPKIVESIGLRTDEFSISDEVYEYMIDNYCSDEQGIRKLEKCIETILMKVNLYRLTRNKFYLEGFETEEENITITRQMSSKILNNFFNINEGANLMLQMMYN